MRVLAIIALVAATAFGSFLSLTARPATAAEQRVSQGEQTYWIYYRMSTDQFWQTSPSAYPAEQARTIIAKLQSQGYEVRTGDGSGPPSPPLPPIK